MIKKVSLTTDQVKKVAKLANLPITSSQEEKYADQLSAIIDYIEQLQKVDTTGVEPTYNITPLASVFRSDETDESLSQEEALQNGVQKQGYFVTKGVFENE